MCRGYALALWWEACRWSQPPRPAAEALEPTAAKNSSAVWKGCVRAPWCHAHRQPPMAAAPPRQPAAPRARGRRRARVPAAPRPFPNIRASPATFAPSTTTCGRTGAPYARGGFRASTAGGCTSSRCTIMRWRARWALTLRRRHRCPRRRRHCGWRWIPPSQRRSPARWSPQPPPLRGIHRRQHRRHDDRGGRPTRPSRSRWRVRPPCRRQRRHHRGRPRGCPPTVGGWCCQLFRQRWRSWRWARGGWCCRGWSARPSRGGRTSSLHRHRHWQRQRRRHRRARRHRRRRTRCRRRRARRQRHHTHCRRRRTRCPRRCPARRRQPYRRSWRRCGRRRCTSGRFSRSRCRQRLLR